jgi:hypothetical protein
MPGQTPRRTSRQFPSGFIPLTSVSRPPRRGIALLAGAGLSLWSSAAPGQAGERVLLRQLYGDLALEVRAGAQGAMRIGAADGQRSIAVSVIARDLKLWADSATKLLAARPPGRGKSAQWEAVVAGPGVAAGSMALARNITPADTSIALLVTDPQFVGVRTVLTMPEARSLVAAIRRAANAALAPPRPAKPPPRR